MHLFPFSLKEKVKTWLDTNTNVTTGDKMQTTFLKMFFFIGKLAAVRHAATSFSQNKNELSHESWEKFKSRCKVVLPMRSLCANLSRVFIQA